MAFVLNDRVFETTTTTGTGTLNLGGAPDSYQSFVDGIGDGNTCFYVITNDTDWETGIGTVTSGSPDTLSRDTVYQSSNSDAKVNFGSGTKNVFVALISEFIATENKVNTFTANNTFSGDVTFTGDNTFTGALTKSNDTFITGRNAADNANVDIIKINASDEIEVGGELRAAGKITNVTDPTAAQDAATKAYVDETAQIQLQTSVATTSGTVIDLTGVPAGVNRVYFYTIGASTNGTSPMVLQVLTAGGVINTGYVGTISDTSSAASSSTATYSSSARLVNSQVAAALFNITVTLHRLKNDVWRIEGISEAGANYSNRFSVTIDAGDDLTGVRFTTNGGTDAFDAGEAIAAWEF